ncbi:telomere-binding protein cav [Drosophila eugracilis]|uniref:telomere-binding protein cav n=1 Tax=Drosophila eugracilis TaxID=29029 RepID=UPI0007E5E247|nr:telomere-binding protein cav [Drosophila eugracilis]
MSVRKMSEYLRNYLAEEDKRVRAICNGEDGDAEMILWMHSKTRITEEDLARTYTEDEVRELCLRTKVKVNMTSWNCLWDAKKRFDKKNRLENRSDTYVNRMFLKAVRRKMVEPYTDEYVANQRDVASAETKKRNNYRLDKWRNQRNALETESSPARETFVDQAPLGTQDIDDEMLDVTEADPLFTTFSQTGVEQPQGALAVPNASSWSQSSSVIEVQPEGLVEVIDLVSSQSSNTINTERLLHVKEELLSESITQQELNYETGAQNQAQNEEVETSSLTELFGIGDQEEDHQKQGGSEVQYTASQETQMQESWAYGGGINSESMSTMPSLSSQDLFNSEPTDPNYETFGTQLNQGTSTQEAAN